MAISTFITPSGGDELISFGAFPGYAPYHGGAPALRAVHGASPPETEEGSPESNPPAGGDDDDDDDIDAFEGKDSKRSLGGSAAAGKRSNKSSSAERRATHNAIERARRESLNGRFLELANALPTMATVKRPSKSVIVNKSLEWIYEAQIREHALVRENSALRAEVNELRARLHMPPMTAPGPMPAPGDYARFKTPGSGAHMAGPQMNHHGYLGSVSQPMPENYFAPNPNMGLGSLGAMHHPSQYVGFAHSAAPGAPPAPPSAPANMLAFTNPFQPAFGTGFVNADPQRSPATGHQQPSSPASKSEGASNDITSPIDISSSSQNNHSSTITDSPHSFTHSLADSLSTSPEAASSGGQYVNMHAVQLQQQRNLAAFAAAQQQQHATQQQGCGSNGTSPAISNGPWATSGLAYMF